MNSYHMSKIRFYIRTHLKTITKCYDILRENMRNLRYWSKCNLKGIKLPDTFFFVIDPYRNHPGLADRLKAIIAAYNQAKQNNLKFKIVYKIPFSLEDYLMPVDSEDTWIANYQDLEYSFLYTRFVNEKNGWILHAQKGIQYHCYNYKGDLLPEVFPDSGYEWHQLFRELFRPNDEILKAIADTKLEQGSYIAVHLRFVNALENFEDSYYNGLSTEAEKRDLIQRCRRGVKDIIEKARDEGMENVVLFSDSRRFLEEVSDLPVIILDSTSLGHVSYTNAHNQIIKTFLDFFLISRAKRVYRIGAKEMYLSSCFALCAARAGNVEFNSVVV